MHDAPHPLAVVLNTASLTDLLLPDAVPGRCSCYCATITSVATLSPLHWGVVACPIYVIPYRTRLSLSLPHRILTIHLMGFDTVCAAALPKPSDQRRPSRPRRRPSHLVQGSHQAGPPPLAVELVEPALIGEGPGRGCFLDVVAVPRHADEG